MERVWKRNVFAAVTSVDTGADQVLLIQCWLQGGCGFQSPGGHGIFPAVSQIHTFDGQVTLT